MTKEKRKLDHKPKRSFIAWLFFLIGSGSSLLLALALAVMMLPQDLSRIEGYGEGAKTREARDLTAVLRESLERGHEVTISEDELNRWIGQNLKLKQQGLLGHAIEIKGLGIRLREDEIEMVMERSFYGLKSTLSMYFQVLVEADDNKSSKEVLLHGGPLVEFFPLLKRGGRFGRLTVPQGYIHLVKPAFFQLGEVCDEELGIAFRKMHDISVEEGQVVFTPSPSIRKSP